jgi:hypothetical protein
MIFGPAAETFPDQRRRSDRSRRGLWRRFLFLLRECRFLHPLLLARRETARFAFLDFLATFKLPIGSIKTRHRGRLS